MSDQSPFGRVDVDGTVYVTTSEGERAVGQWPQGDPEAALAFYRTRYEGLLVEVDLLEQRIKSGALSPDDASSTVGKVRASVAVAQAVGDLDALTARLDALRPLIEERRQARKAERAVKAEESKAAKVTIVEEAETLAAGDDWGNGANRLRELLDAWKIMPRIDKSSDDELWHRFSSARTTYTRRRKQHFSELSDKREGARAAKEKLVAEAEELSGSKEWGPTARAYRDLMTRWKAAGGAQKAVDDALWKRFREAQDAFFGARDVASAQLDAEYSANAEVKQGLLSEAERLLPVSNVRTAREAFRNIADRWDAAGKVPRGDMTQLEDRFKKVEQIIRGAEDDRWRHSNPEAQARASDTVRQLEASIGSLEAKLAKAVSAGNDKAATQARADIAARQSWLDEARKTLQEFGG